MLVKGEEQNGSLSVRREATGVRGPPRHLTFCSYTVVVALWFLVKTLASSQSLWVTVADPPLCSRQTQYTVAWILELLPLPCAAFGMQMQSRCNGRIFGEALGVLSFLVAPVHLSSRVAPLHLSATLDEGRFCGPGPRPLWCDFVHHQLPLTGGGEIH